MGQTAISCTDRRQASPADRIQLENIQCITLIRSVVKYSLEANTKDGYEDHLGVWKGARRYSERKRPLLLP
jgi:hypothetical protein